ARDAGIANVSVDLMYGLPGLDPEGWSRTVDAVLDWKPDHLSAYGLTLDAGSLWGAAGVAGLPPEETVVAQYWRLARAAAERGFSVAGAPSPVPAVGGLLEERRGSVTPSRSAARSTPGVASDSWPTPATVCGSPRRASSSRMRCSSNCYNRRRWMPVIATS